MYLNDWIESLAPLAASKVAASRLGEKRRTVDSWRRFENRPSFRAALKIVQISDGLVDFNGIYMPFKEAVEGGHAKL